MIDIYQKIYSLITSDATMQSLIGATASDNRLYQEHPPDEHDESNPWMIYYMNTGSLFGPDQIGDKQKPDAILTIDIYGLNKDEVQAVYDQLEVILNRSRAIQTASHIVYYIGIESADDMVEIRPDNENLFHKNSRWRLKDIVEL